MQPSTTTADEMRSQRHQFFEATENRFGDLRRGARRRLVRDAVRYTSAYRDVPAAAADWIERDEAGQSAMPIVMAGHQPTLFHPGVWFKNFALDRLATKTNSLAVNLVVDNDVASGVAVRVPQQDLSNGRWQAVSVPYDAAGGGVPFEQTAISDREMFCSFDERLTADLLGLVESPSIQQLWPHAEAALNRCDIAACAIAQARHGLEADLGLQSLEIPIGVVARDPAFARFTLELLVDLPRFAKIYNDSTHHYRRHHGIRSSAHPVPNLAVEGEWFECPLWIYGDDAPHRRAAWARRDGDRLIISDRQSSEMTLDISDLDAAAKQWTEQLSPQFKVRPRALLTTMYARWILSDCFLHGIGGGKYDQLGDRIAAAYFGVEPPPYYVVSATVKLASVDDEEIADRRRFLKRRLRDCRYQPEQIEHRWSEQHRELISRKRAMLAEVPPPQSRASWHQALDRLNRTLSDELSVQRTEAAAELDQINRDDAAARLLGSREHPFCIFPLQGLTETFASMLDEVDPHLTL